MSTEQRGIGSVEVGGALLRVLTEAEGPMMLRDLAASAGMTAAKAHPYMVSFMRLGLVEQDGASGRYELGPLALQMGLASMRRLNPVRIATEAIVELVLRTNKTVALRRWRSRKFHRHCWEKKPLRIVGRKRRSFAARLLISLETRVLPKLCVEESRAPTESRHRFLARPFLCCRGGKRSHCLQ